MVGRALSLVAIAVVLGVGAAAVIDSVRGVAERRTTAATPATARDCVDGGPCLRGLRELVGFYRECVGSWNDAANRANRAAVVDGGFAEATLFRSGRAQCSIRFASSATEPMLLAGRLDGRWSAVGARRPDEADDTWEVNLRPDGTLALRGG